MTLEYVATVEIDCAMRLEPDVGMVEQFVETPAAAGRFDVERDALLAEIADREVEAGAVVERRERPRSHSSGRFDADDVGAEVGEQPPAHLAALVDVVDDADAGERAVEIRRHSTSSVGED